MSIRSFYLFNAVRPASRLLWNNASVQNATEVSYVHIVVYNVIFLSACFDLSTSFLSTSFTASQRKCILFWLVTTGVLNSEIWKRHLIHFQCSVICSLWRFINRREIISEYSINWRKMKINLQRTYIELFKIWFPHIQIIFWVRITVFSLPRARQIVALNELFKNHSSVTFKTMTLYFCFRFYAFCLLVSLDICQISDDTGVLLIIFYLISFHQCNPSIRFPKKMPKYENQPYSRKLTWNS